MKQHRTACSHLTHTPFLAEALEQRVLFTVLTFEPASGTWAHYSALSQNYGDRVTAASQGGFKYGTTGGATAKVVASYGAPGATVSTWDTGYGNLKNVVFSNPNGTKFQMTLTADAGYLVTLKSFDMAGYGNDYTIKSVQVIDGSGNALYSKTNVKILGTPSSSHTSFTFATPLTAGKLTIKFDSSNAGGYNVGMDNVQFGQTVLSQTKISGTVFKDTNGNGKRDSGEGVLSGWHVYIDKNNNGEYDSGETFTTTDSSGNYSLTFASAGTYIVSVQLKRGYYQTGPHDLFYKVTAPGASVTGAIFGVKAISPA